MTPYETRKRLRSARIGVITKEKARLKKPALGQSEDELHRAVVELLTYGLPPDAVFHHSPNEGKRGRRARGALKTHGTLAGWPDIEIIYRGMPIFIELKRDEKAKPSAAQVETHARLRAAGCPVAICRSLAEVQTHLMLLVPLRVRFT